MVGVYIVLVLFAVVMFGLFIVGITSEEFMGSGFILFLVLFFVFCFIFLSLENTKKDENESIPVECQEIKSFALHSETSSSTSGAFYLGCGYVTSSGSIELKYYFYKKGQVGYVLCSISASRVELVETDEKPPGIEGIFTDSGDIKLFEDYIIYVPTGTIFEEYKVEL